MNKRDPRVDAHIRKAAGFAKPILEYIRSTVHSAIPDVEETIKWGMPFFMHEGPVAMMAAFKQHVRFGFWRGRHFENVVSVKDLPSKKELVAMLKGAAQAPRKSAPAKKKTKKLEAPKDLVASLKKNKKAAAAWDDFSPTHRREYITWLTDAKTDETRNRRLGQAMEWIAEGKGRNWKYMKR